MTVFQGNLAFEKRENPEIVRTIKHRVWADLNTKGPKIMPRRSPGQSEGPLTVDKQGFSLSHRGPNESTDPHYGYFPVTKCVIAIGTLSS